MRKLLLFFVVILIAALFTASRVCAEEAAVVQDNDGIRFVFDSQESIMKWSAKQAEAYFLMGHCAFRPVTDDSRFIYYFDSGEQFDASEYKYFAIRYRADTTVGTACFFSTTDINTSFGQNGYGAFSVVTGGWTDKIIDMSKYNFWNGTVTAFRLDLINGLDPDAYVLIDRIGFFTTEEQARAFIDEGLTEDFTKDAVIRRNLQKVTIPGGTLSDGYNIFRYMLSDTALPGGDAVVKYTDADGNEAIVALCYTNSVGHTAFVSRKAGTYTLAANRKTYTDTAGHWGEKYIDFVSDRALFGGTSDDEFSPDMPVTRGMFAAVMGRMHGVDVSEYTSNNAFTDVPAAEYYAPYIEWAKTEGIMAGISDTAFAPEEPVSRETMAKAISNYIKAYNYNLTAGEVTDFADIGDADPQNADAVRFVQSLGIINGITPTVFSPKGISTRAEAAAVMERVIKSILGIPLEYKSNFEKDRILIGAWTAFPQRVSDGLIKTYAEAGLNLLVGTTDFDLYEDRIKTLELADRYGLQVLFHNYLAKIYSVPPFDDAEFYDHPSFLGHHLRDEPGTDEFAGLSEVEDQYHSNYPDKMAFINLLPIGANAAQLKYGAGASDVDYYDPDPDLYKKYVEAYARQFHSDYMCVDIYPIQKDNKLYDQYCENLDIFGTVCREYNKDFWLYVQAVSLWGSPNPTEYTFRWQFYTALSFGVKSFIHYTYGSTAKNSVSFIDENGTPTTTYYAAQKVNAELTALSDTYVQYKNLGAFNINASEDTPHLNFGNQYKDFGVLTDISADAPVLVGCFDRKEGDGHAFTLVNMTNFLQEDRKANVTFTPDDDCVVTAYVYGEPEVLTANNGVYSVTLDSAQGVFITME